MVKIALKLKANLENVERLEPSPDPQFRWYFKFTCNNCGEVSEKWTYASLAEAIPAQRGSAVNHFVNKCKLCARENSMTILPESISYLSSEDCSEFKTVVVLDCRGLEPKDYEAREGWVVTTAENGKIFSNVDLGDGEWADYCDKTNKPVGVYEIEHSFERVK